ncbi:MAG: SUMF1/EgtB/PvdO family nonheme iron enzyme [Lentisphaeria bacterium]|nr:SUMF1/EgtB/PvdO family nonheme iron enzyme [Lentisphaeria bacterium]
MELLLHEYPPDLTKDACRTTELWLRQIPAGTFTMGSPVDELGHWDDEVRHKVTLTKPFYIGVFECTQAQWEYVMGDRDRPSYFNNDLDYATRPVEQVSYDMIRGADAGANWPDSNDVDATSFMGVLRAKTGLMFDLPTEAQWEYACRAGTTEALNSGKNLETISGRDASMDEVGRYRHNGGQDSSQDCDTEHGTAKVGSYQPNNWGLYDMHGNVIEWCLDWWDGSAYNSAAVEDPAGDATGSSRVLRGGRWSYNAGGCRSAYRTCIVPSGGNDGIGFRVVFLPPTYAVTVVKGTADKTEAAEGETVTITANMPGSGETFDKWTGSGVTFANAADAETTFKMPAKAVTVTATFKKISGEKTYKIVVVNGTADKAKAAAGETVTLTAKPAPAGKVFDRWTGGATFDDPNAAETTFTMPAKAVTPKAIYKKK